MTTYELINPSDGWTFKAPSDKIAFLVALLVGRGQTPAKRDGWQSEFYIGGMGDPDADYRKLSGGVPIEGAFTKNKKEIVPALRSFMIDREKCARTLKGDELLKWNDKHRSSMNDFGGAALQIADQLVKAKATSKK